MYVSLSFHCFWLLGNFLFLCWYCFIQLATSNGESEVVELLLAHRADINVKTNDGKLARDLATDDVTRSLIDAAAARAKSSN